MAKDSTMGRAAWIQVGIATVMQNMATGLAFGSFGTIVLAIEHTYGASRPVSSLIVSVMTASLLITAAILGRLINGISIRAIMACGALFGSLAFLLMSVTHTALELMAVYALLLGPATAFWGTLPAMTLTARWASRERRGLAMGLVNMPIAVMLAPLMIAPVLQQHGIRTVYQILSLVSLSMLPLIFFVKDRPRDQARIEHRAKKWVPVFGKKRCDNKDLEHDADSRKRHHALVMASSHEAPAPAPSAPHAARNSVLHTRIFWFLIIADGLITGAGTMKLAHFVPLVTEQGWSFDQANVLLSLSGGSGVLGAFIFGTLADRIGGTRAMMGNAAVQAAMWSVFLAPVNYGVLLADAILVGACGGGVQGAFGAAVAEHFGQEAFGRVLGLASLFTLPLLFGLTPLTGLIHDHTGTYHLPMGFMVGCLLIALALLGLAARKPAVEHRAKKWEPVFRKKRCVNKDLEHDGDS